MQWSEIRAADPDQWLVVEALEAHSDNEHRIFDRIAVVEVCSDGRAAMKRYSELQRAHPHRELCFVHTSKAKLEFEERLWLGSCQVKSKAGDINPHAYLCLTSR